MRRSTARDKAVGALDFRSWVGILVLLHVAVGLLLYEPTLFPGGDNAGYMILGESLRSGSGYRDLYLPTTPVHTKYPPFYPLLLAVLGWFGGLQLFKLASLALTAGAVALTAYLGRRLVGPGLSLTAAAILAVNPVLLEYSHYVLSEAPFVFLVLVTLLFVGSRQDRWPVAGVLTAAASFLVRTAGLPLLLAVAALPILRRQRRRAAGTVGVGLGVAAAWAFFQHREAPGSVGYLGQLVLRNPYEPELGRAGLLDLATRAAGNLWRYTSEVLPTSFTGAPRGGGVLVFLGVCVAGLALWGWLARATEEIDYPELFVLLYGGLISLWPDVWTDRRFLLPILPLILLYAAGGTAGALQAVSRGRLGGSARHLAAGVMAAGLGVLALLFILQVAPVRIRCVVAYRASSPCDAPEFASFYEAARWARGHTEPDAVIANRKPTLFFWYSRRRGEVYRYSSEPSLVMRSLEQMGADYVVVDQVSATTVRYLIPAIQAHRDRFEVVYRDGQPETVLLRFRAAPETAMGTK